MAGARFSNRTVSSKKNKLEASLTDYSTKMNKTKFPCNTAPLALLDDFVQQEGLNPKMSQQKRENPTVDRFFEILTEEIEKKGVWEELYHFFSKEIAGLKYAPSDIQDFILRLEGLRTKDDLTCAPYLLSALINKSDESNFEFYLGGVSGQLNGLGQSNEKKLIFHGDVRSNLGVEMKKGKITLFGNAGKNVGIRLKNGEIEVFGDAGERVGYDADGGTIRVHGNIESLGWFDLKEGPMVMLGKENIFQYDRQLIKDGNQIAMPINK